MVTMLTPPSFSPGNLPILLRQLCASKTKLIGKEEKNRASGSFTYKWFPNPSKTTKRLQPVRQHLNPTAQNKDQTSRLTQAANKLCLFNLGERSIAALLRQRDSSYNVSQDNLCSKTSTFKNRQHCYNKIIILFLLFVLTMHCQIKTLKFLGKTQFLLLSNPRLCRLWFHEAQHWDRNFQCSQESNLWLWKHFFPRNTPKWYFTFFFPALSRELAVIAEV